jgi:hypothetical protein
MEKKDLNLLEKFIRHEVALIGLFARPEFGCWFLMND